MNEKAVSFLASPKTREPLMLDGENLVTASGEKYEIIRDVPLLLPEDTAADWYRELMEAIFWEYPDKLNELRTELQRRIKKYGREYEYAALYRETIEAVYKDKDGITDALTRYAASDTARWAINKENGVAVTKESIKKFKQVSSRSCAKERVKYIKEGIAGEGEAKQLPYYTAEVHKASPQTVVELSTGSGSGTAAVALTKAKDCLIFTVDIGFDCHGNVIGIRKLLGQKDTLIPVCANFWYLPFQSGCIDVVCSNHGLDESRENDKTIAEAVRVLKPGGRFINAGRKDAFMRQYNILEPFGFTKDEAVALLRKCRLYADTGALVECCRENGLTLMSEREFVIHEKRTETVTVFIKS